MSIADYPETTTPTSEEKDLARASSRALSKLASRLMQATAPAGGARRVQVQVKADGEAPDEQIVSIPVQAFRLLVDILNEMAQGNAVTVIPVHAELTTQQAAEILNVSRPFVIKLIEEEKLPCKLVGTHRRVRYDDLMKLKKQMDSDRLRVLEELAAQAQELDMGY